MNIMYNALKYRIVDSDHQKQFVFVQYVKESYRIMYTFCVIIAYLSNRYGGTSQKIKIMPTFSRDSRVFASFLFFR
jgi:hypothetical protein